MSHFIMATLHLAKTPHKPTTPQWALPYMGMFGRFCGDDPPFEIFYPTGSLFYVSSRSDRPPFLQIFYFFLSLSYLDPEILGSKVGLNFHQNVLFNSL